MGKISQHFPRPDWWTALFSGILAATAMGALWYARAQIKETREDSEVQIKEARHQAQIQHLLTLENEFDQEPMATYRRGFAAKRLARNDDDPMELYKVLNFFDTVGLLVDRGYLDEEDVWSVFGYWIFNVNSDSEMRANIEDDRKRYPYVYTAYLSLVSRMERIDAAHHGPGSQISKDELMEFYREELTIVGGTPINTHKRPSKQTKNK
jgi:hypothetical protein